MIKKIARIFRSRLKAFDEKYIRGIKTYKPRNFSEPSKTLSMNSAWKGLEKIIPDIIQQSKIGTGKCLEFGVEFGYSTVIFSNYFDKVTGVDIFTGDPHAGYHGDIYEKVKKDLLPYQNIELVQSDYKDFIRDNNEKYDLIHVDIIHTYEATYDCGLWAAIHSGCAIFHDTESFPEVKRAVADIAKKSGKRFYNYPYSNGLGIVY